ncbi:MAG: T9SS type A sorting domain-containing protein [Bacteroidota bacterium]
MLKLNDEGDTLWTKFMHSYGNVMSLKNLPDGNLLLAIAVFDSLNINPIRLQKINTGGDILWSVDIDSSSGDIPFDIYIMPDGGALLVGQTDSYTGLSDGFALRVGARGEKIWRKRYTPNDQTYLYHVERCDGDSGFLISGVAGSRIWGAWLNEDGKTLNERIFWQEPNSRFLIRAGVMNSPEHTLVAWGSNFGTDSPLWYMGKSYPDGEHIWDSTFYGNQCASVYINTDCEIMLEYGGDSGLFFRKQDSNGRPIKILQIASSVYYNGKFINSVAWGNDGTAVFAGYAVIDHRRIYDDFWFCKMSDVGYPYLGVQKSLVAEDILVPYPNPARNALFFNSKYEGHLSIYTTSGQTIQTQAYQPGDKTDISSLAPGLYIYRFSSSKGVSNGKIIKE